MILVFGKLIVDLAMYQMYAAFILSYVFGETPSVLFCLGYAAAALLAAAQEELVCLRTKEKRAILLLISGGLLAGTCFFGSSVPVTISALPMVFYLLYMGIKRAWYADYEEQKEHFRKGFYPLVLIPFFALYQFSKMKAAIPAALPWVLFYLISGFVQLRLMREQISGAKNGEMLRKQAVDVTLLLLVGIALYAAGIPDLIAALIKDLWVNVLSPFLIWLVSGAFSLLIEILAWVIGNIQGNSKVEIDVEPWEGLGKSDVRYPGYTMELWQRLSPVTVGIGIAVAAAVVLFFLFRFFVGRKGEKQQESDVIERQEELSEKGSGRIGFFAPRDPAKAIRYYFRKYLAILEKREVTIGRGDTSEELAQKGCSVMEEKEDAIRNLRRLYLSARYRQDYAGTPENRKKAAELWKEISK